jgi:hypothetical protein
MVESKAKVSRHRKVLGLSLWALCVCQVMDLRAQGYVWRGSVSVYFWRGYTVVDNQKTEFF